MVPEDGVILETLLLGLLLLLLLLLGRLAAEYPVGDIPQELPNWACQPSHQFTGQLPAA